MSKLFRNLSSLIPGRSDAASGEPPPAAASQPDLPLVAYEVTPQEMDASLRLRRSRSVSLLRNSASGALTTTTPALPTLPSGAARAHAGPARPFLTQTERVRLQVMQAQIQLASLRLYEGPIDGVLSAATVTALRYFQTLKGLRPSGALAAGTLAALGVPTLD